MKSISIKSVLDNIRSSLRAKIPVFSTIITSFMLVSMMPNAYAAPNVLGTAVSTLSSLVETAGAFIGAWGLVILGSNVKDHNGPGINNGIWTIVGGAMVFAAGAVIQSVA